VISSSVPTSGGDGGGVAVHKDSGSYYLYVASVTNLKRYNVDNPAAPVLDGSWNPPIFSGADNLTVDSDGTVFLAGGGMVRRVAADGSAVTHSVSLADAADVAVYQDLAFVIREANNAVGLVAVFNKADLTSAGPDMVVPDLQAAAGRPRGTLAQFTAIDVSADGRLFIAEENYTAGGNGIPLYTPPATTFNPAPGPITGRIYFDRVLVSSSIAVPCSSATCAKEEVIDELTAQLGTMGDKADKRLEKAIEAIEKSLNPDWWVDDEPHPKEGKKIFDEERKAVSELSKKELEGNATVASAIQTLVEIDRELASDAIADAAGGDAKKLAKANEELAKGDAEGAEGDFDKAIEHYRKAWEEAQKAMP
jgi:tetratricopeptide (TPR) repeat protein